MAAMGCPQPKPGLEPFIEAADSNAGHAVMIALQSVIATVLTGILSRPFRQDSKTVQQAAWLQYLSLKAAKRWDSQPISKSGKSVAVPVLPK
jgi:hypothetical protein